RALIGNRGERVQASAAARRKSTVGQEAAGGPGAGSAVDALVHVAGSAELRRHREQAQVVIQNVVGHAEAAADCGIAAEPAGRIGKAHTRSEVLVLRLRFAEVDEAGHARCRVQALQTFAEWHRRELVAQANVDGKVFGNTEVVITINVNGRLIA